MTIMGFLGFYWADLGRVSAAGEEEVRDVCFGGSQLRCGLKRAQCATPADGPTLVPSLIRKVQIKTRIIF